VKDNIRYGRLDATDEAVREVARHANAHDFIMELKDGYDAVVGERGVKLSVGQKQRISIARALLADPKILILDEATSSLDSESEAAIQEALAYLLKGRTTFVIAHRLSTIMHANKIVVLDHGEVKEVGPHAELLKAGGLYHRLFMKQFERLRVSAEAGAVLQWGESETESVKRNS
jgi:subfamily B ATP-binding cassette protein MsbA